MAPISSVLRRPLRVYQVFGANTEVGKTVFSTILCKAAKQQETTAYLKPISTGPLEEADDRNIQKFTPGVVSDALFQFDQPISPHIAATLSGKPPPTDHAILTAIHDCVSRHADRGLRWLFVETAGGVHSPGPSGTTQADLYMPLRLPVVLVGDCNLGGISQTISAFESLKIRGYDVEAVLLFEDDRYQNYQYLTPYLRKRYGIPVRAVLRPPPRHDIPAKDEEQMFRFYEEMSASSQTRDILEHLKNRHAERLSRLESMATKAHKYIWYPFTQQKLLSSEKITIIDSAHGDYFQTLVPQQESSPAQSLLQPSFDGSASWWTQGLGHANPQLTLAAAHAAGRYGHVMFAEAVHEPALVLAETLLQSIPNPRLARVFFSDNGSTGVEVALKMALRATRMRYKWDVNERIGVLGLKGGYHGDTMGAMDSAEPCVFNEKVEWYEGKGFWFDYPTVMRSGDSWVVNVPGPLSAQAGPDQEFRTLADIFDFTSRRDRSEMYERYITGTLRKLQAQGHKFGALILEPVVLGAGGMALVDPLFQRTLVNTVRRSAHLFSPESSALSDVDTNTWIGLPVICDEVFTGFYRLGSLAAASLLDIHPDISVHAKLLTGGLLPLCATLASDSIFRAFESDDKSDALLHGHSYTAHPVGCQVALESLREMQRIEDDGEWGWGKGDDWEVSRPVVTRDSVISGDGSHRPIRSIWPFQFLEWVARQTDRVAGVWALGSVLAIHMRTRGAAGYKSTAAADLQKALMEGTGAGESTRWNVHSRVLGNVFYIMGSLRTQKPDVELLQDLIRRALA